MCFGHMLIELLMGVKMEPKMELLMGKTSNFCPFLDQHATHAVIHVIHICVKQMYIYKQLNAYRIPNKYEKQIYT